jgi:hypothetical protein
VNFNTHPQQVLWFRDQYRSGALILKPPFQRKPVWAAKQKCFLIESILLNVPVPEVFVQQTIIDGEASFAVVDGQQRIRAVLQFLGVERDSSEDEFNGFPLDKLEPTSPWKDLRFGDLKPADRDRLLEYVFAVRFLKVDDDKTIRDLFIRLNKYLTKLTDQELRNATYTGPFVEVSTQLADDDYWIEQRLVTAAQIRRMKDVEFVSDLLIGVMYGPQGGNARTIDEYYQRFEDAEDEFPKQKQTIERFKLAQDTVKALFPELPNAGRWGNRTDYYSLFVAIAVTQLKAHLPSKSVRALREALNDFGTEVDERLSTANAKVSRPAIAYTRAVEKGATDKKRRADRHTALLSVLEPHFSKKVKE